jgi:hypothetical protein
MNFKDYIETKYNSAGGNSSNPNILRTENESVQDGTGSQYMNS